MRVFLTVGEASFEVPAPEQIRFVQNSKATRISLHGLGTYLLPAPPEAQTTVLSGTLSATENPAALITALERQRDAGLPLSLTLTGGAMPASRDMLIESLSYQERFGEAGAVDYQLQLTAYRALPGAAEGGEG